MAVGTGAISLQEVVDEEGAQTTLKGMADNYTGTLNPTYGTAPVTSLAEFRGYITAPTGVTVYALPLTNLKGEILISTACGASKIYQYYTTNPAGTINNGDTWYSDSPGVNVLNGSGRYLSDGSNAIIVSSVGVTSGKDFC